MSTITATTPSGAAWTISATTSVSGNRYTMPACKYSPGQVTCDTAQDRKNTYPML